MNVPVDDPPAVGVSSPISVDGSDPHVYLYVRTSVSVEVGSTADTYLLRDEVSSIEMWVRRHDILLGIDLVGHTT